MAIIVLEKYSRTDKFALMIFGLLYMYDKNHKITRFLPMYHPAICTYVSSGVTYNAMAIIVLEKYSRTDKFALMIFGLLYMYDKNHKIT